MMLSCLVVACGKSLGGGMAAIRHPVSRTAAMRGGMAKGGLAMYAVRDKVCTPVWWAAGWMTHRLEEQEPRDDAWPQGPHPRDFHPSAFNCRHQCAANMIGLECSPVCASELHIRERTVGQWPQRTGALSQYRSLAPHREYH